MYSFEPIVPETKQNPMNDAIQNSFVFSYNSLNLHAKNTHFSVCAISQIP